MQYSINFFHIFVPKVSFFIFFGLRIFVSFFSASLYYFKFTLYGSPSYALASALIRASRSSSFNITTITLSSRISTNKYGESNIISYLKSLALLESGNIEPITEHSANFIGFDHLPDISGSESISAYISPNV